MPVAALPLTGLVGAGVTFACCAFDAKGSAASAAANNQKPIAFFIPTSVG